MQEVVIITAPGKEVDFVSRFFAPGSGVDEDPVTGSAHTTLTPFWSEKLGKTRLTAQQLSQRKGELTCELHWGKSQNYRKGCDLFDRRYLYLKEILTKLKTIGFASGLRLIWM